MEPITISHGLLKHSVRSQPIAMRILGYISTIQLLPTNEHITTREILHVINILHVIIFFELRTPDISVCTCTIIYYVVLFKLCIHKLYHMYNIIVRVQKLLRVQ